MYELLVIEDNTIIVLQDVFTPFFLLLFFFACLFVSFLLVFVLVDAKSLDYLTKFPVTAIKHAIRIFRLKRKTFEQALLYLLTVSDILQ